MAHSLARALGLVGLVLCAPARAQVLAERQDFAVERFRLALDPAGLLALEGASVLPHGRAAAGLWLGFADDPLVVYRQEGAARTRTGGLVHARTGGSLVLAVGLFDRAALGLELPFVLGQSRPTTVEGIGGPLAPLAGLGLGGPRLAPKLRLIGQEDSGLALAVQASFVLPAIMRGSYWGQDSLVFEPELLLSLRTGGLRGGLSLGARLRRPRALGALRVEDELTAALGLGWRPGGRALELQATLALATRTGAFGRVDSSYGELLGGLSWLLHPQGSLFAAAGAGFTQAHGTPDWRLLAGLRFHGAEQPARRLPPAPLDPDRDDDGVYDWDDRCPERPGVLEERGCPEQDRDGDGLADHRDRCPAEREDRDGHLDTDGCLDPDDDTDSVLDRDDACPREPGVPQRGGCPDPDVDGDGLGALLDQCPTQPGPWDRQGCPQQPLALVGSERIELREKVHFETGRAVIERRSYPLLQAVVELLLARPELGPVEVEGHTDDRGADRANQLLSLRRAEAVRQHLVRAGVPAQRLSAAGYGEERPVASNRTTAGRAENRRVELRLLHRSAR